MIITDKKNPIKIETTKNVVLFGEFLVAGGSALSKICKIGDLFTSSILANLIVAVM